MGDMIRWVVLRVRLYRPDRNPVRRRSDRLEAVGAVVALALLLLSVWPAVVVGRMAYDNGTRAERAGASARRAVTATLVRDAPTTIAEEHVDLGAKVEAVARWTGPAGKPMTGPVTAPAGARAGTRVSVWVDARGVPASPPRRHGETVFDTVTAALLVLAAGAVVSLSGFRGLRCLLDRGRYAAWDAAWAEAARRWRRA
ncbi:hypothetical protein [Nonomuraea roseoviolacea]|uniref:DUF3592 domain-containing protein n=1 Tax=Nonomuraea roseoviolacea subsp. carminata TaxID=160689 RepID=A0ABT1KEX6_9ACTN|nr:hypothetical protein [Nonomuraea roseoviolacea]MCP2352580.1 hypothetical protein [Nonomuraea roseoviolacea subsp. carminata]